jgi:hypothetical protein
MEAQEEQGRCMVGAGQEWARHGVVKGQIQEWRKMGARKQQRSRGKGRGRSNGMELVRSSLAMPTFKLIYLYF